MLMTKPPIAALALVLALGAIGPLPAEAAPSERAFRFAYSLMEVRTETGRSALERRLSQQAMHYCAREPAATPVSELGCRRSVIQAVRTALAAQAG